MAAHLSGVENSSATLFTVFQTLLLNNVNPKKFLKVYLEACAQNHGPPPENIRDFLPRNMSESQKLARRYYQERAPLDFLSLPVYRAVIAVVSGHLQKSSGFVDLLFPNPSPIALSYLKIVCDQFQWLRPDGRRKDMSCRVAMLRMHHDGLICLPPPRKKNGNGNNQPKLTEGCALCTPLN